MRNWKEGACVLRMQDNRILMDVLMTAVTEGKRRKRGESPTDMEM